MLTLPPTVLLAKTSSVKCSFKKFPTFNSDNDKNIRKAEAVVINTGSPTASEAWMFFVDV